MKKRANHQEFPAGWNENKIRELIAHYDSQTDEEGAAEIETAEEMTDETLMSVPTELVPAISQLIKNHQQRAGNKRTPSRRLRKAGSRRTGRLVRPTS